MFQSEWDVVLAIYQVKSSNKGVSNIFWLLSKKKMHFHYLTNLSWSVWASLAPGPGHNGCYTTLAGLTLFLFLSQFLLCFQTLLVFQFLSLNITKIKLVKQYLLTILTLSQTQLVYSSTFNHHLSFLLVMTYAPSRAMSLGTSKNIAIIWSFHILLLFQW